MRLRLLGTGAAEGIPALLCNCGVCCTARKRRGREIRQNSCALVTSSGGASLLIDLPPQIKMAMDLYRVDQERLTSVLVTHAHTDHCLGLKYLPDRAMSRNGYREPHVVDLCVPASVTAFSERLTKVARVGAAGEAPYRLRVPRAYERFTTGPFAVTPLETGHAARPGDAGECLGYLIEEGGGTLAYMLDSPAVLPDRTLEHLLSRQIGCLVYDCTFDGSPGDLPGGPGSHSNIEAVIALHRTLHPAVTVASHISHRCLGHRALQRRLGERGQRGIKAGFDGMALRIG